MIISATETALKGLQTQSKNVNEAAQEIAQFGENIQKAQEFSGNPINIDSAGGSFPSLEGPIIDLIQASALYKANAAVLRVDGELQDALLDTFE